MMTGDDLSLENKFLAAVLDTTETMIVVLDRDGRIFRFNTACETISGYSFEEVRGRFLWDIACQTADLETVRTIFHNLTAGLFPCRHENYWKARDGRLTLISWSATALTAQDGSIEYIVFSGNDITERSRIEKEREKLFEIVSASRREWQETFDSITDQIYIIDMDFNIIKANRSFFEYNGVTPQQVVGAKCFQFNCIAGGPGPDCVHVNALSRGKAMSREMRGHGGKDLISISAFPYYSPDGKPVGSVSIMRDVTEQRDQENRLVTSERLAALGRMASGVAHEINNPLAAIAACAEGLLNRTRQKRFDYDLFYDYLSIITEEISRCKNITTGMLSFVREATYEIRELDLHDTITKTLKILELQGKLRTIDVVSSLMDGARLIKGSEGELRQVFLSIISNSIEAMQGKGCLEIETACSGDMVTVTITDSGPGIPEEFIDKIFDPFFSTKTSEGGTGLGLSIANKIITNHNGRLMVCTENGKGAKFRIDLPA